MKRGRKKVQSLKTERQREKYHRWLRQYFDWQMSKLDDDYAVDYEADFSVENLKIDETSLYSTPIGSANRIPTLQGEGYLIEQSIDDFI